MPWCHQCDRMVEDEELARRPRSGAGDGPGLPTRVGVAGPGAPDRCPTCGAELESENGQGPKEAPVKAPWHFKVLVVGTVGYLGYRLYQGIGWLIHHA